tara:strand:- start:51 stop:329 length:279 start_codon:yes stop_codon:yes gene_type:complete
MSWENIIKYGELQRDPNERKYSGSNAKPIREDGKPRNDYERYVGYMTMRSPQEALNIIAELIESQAPIEDQDAWLKAARELGHVEKGSVEDE